MSKDRKITSPCIDICEDIRGVCIGCGRTKKEKKAWKKVDSDEERLEMVRQCLDATAEIGTQALWLREYRRKCIKKGAEWPLEDVVPQAEAKGRR
jgi:predicted Fe-S protein YdhL (DUF1289 family)